MSFKPKNGCTTCPSAADPAAKCPIHYLKISREWRKTAADHKAGDEKCGRDWSCACAPCIAVREGISKEEWLRNRVNIGRAIRTIEASRDTKG